MILNKFLFKLAYCVIYMYVCVCLCVCVCGYGVQGIQYYDYRLTELSF